MLSYKTPLASEKQCAATDKRISLRRKEYTEYLYLQKRFPHQIDLFTSSNGYHQLFETFCKRKTSTGTE